MKPSADEYTVDLQPCAEADLELFRNSWSAGFLGERLYTAADWADAVSACTKLAALWRRLNGERWSASQHVWSRLTNENAVFVFEESESVFRALGLFRVSEAVARS